MKELIGYDPTSGLREYFVTDEHDDTKFHIHYEQDVQPILDRNKMLANMPEYQARGRTAGWEHAASIPQVVILEWKTKYGVDIFNRDHTRAIKRLLNHPDYLYLRVGTGRI